MADKLTSDKQAGQSFWFARTLRRNLEMHRTFTVLALAVAVACTALALLSPAPAAAGNKNRTTKQVSEAVLKNLKQDINFHRQSTWKWQKLMSLKQTPTKYRETTVKGVGYLRWMRDMWSDRRIEARKQAMNPPHRAQWICIHRYERHPTQGWATRTGNGYYGGLQMDLAFQRTYGPELLRRKGTANNWTPIEQMWVAERAHRSGRGFHPWPNTARYCGLI